MLFTNQLDFLIIPVLLFTKVAVDLIGYIGISKLEEKRSRALTSLTHQYVTILTVRNKQVVGSSPIPGSSFFSKFKGDDLCGLGMRGR